MRQIRKLSLPGRWTLKQLLFAGLVLLASSAFIYISSRLPQYPRYVLRQSLGVGPNSSDWYNSMKENADLHSVANRTGSFLVDMPKCKVPHIPLRRFTFWEEGFPQQDVCNLVPNVTYVDYQDVVINIAVLKELGYNLTSVTCCYHTILRATECGKVSNSRRSDNRFCDSVDCHPMTGVRTRPTSAFIHVICHINNHSTNHTTTTTTTTTTNKPSSSKSQRFYENFHMVAVLPVKSNLVQQKLSYWKSHTNLPLNVMIIGLDATSRLNAHRNLPRSLQLLRDLGTLEMRGYNKLDYNTLPCLIPLLSNHTERELFRLCAKGFEEPATPYRTLPYFRLRGPFDRCPWIWKEFSRQNYVTAYFEDQPSISIFNYLKKGFVKRPADIYGRAWMGAAYSYFHHLKESAGHCLGCVTSKQAILQQVVNLARLSQEGKWPFFSFTWMTHVLHDSSVALGGMDVTLTKVISELNERRILENTLLLVMGDHGYHGHSSGVFWFEDRLPTLFVRLPERLVEKYPQAQRALQYNARQLLSTFDLYATLKDVLALGILKNTTLSISSAKHQIPKRGLSLLRQLPDRSCEDLGISREFCTCGPLTVNTDMAEDVALAAHFIVDYINAGLPRICHSLSLNYTLGYAEMGHPLPGTKKYIVALNLIPGDMIFESLVTFKKTGEDLVPDMVDDLRRLNSYNESHIQCLNVNGTLKLMYEPFCFCRNFTVEFQQNLWMSAF